jgi:uncharacterized protein (TIGR03437 family)
MINDAIAAADGGDTLVAVQKLGSFISAANSRQGSPLKSSQAATLATLATIGIQALYGPAEILPAAGFSPGAVAPDSIATLFGAGLSIGSGSADSQPPPTGLAATTLTILDSAGASWLAPLYSVSPTQVNFLVPRGVSTGRATAVIRLDGEISGAATFDVDRVAPGLFTATAAGDAAALVQRVRADGSNTVEMINGPIDLGPETDQVYLILFGTGLRARPAFSSITALIGNREAPVIYAGAQVEFDGLDQVNLRIPRGLAGAGRVEIGLTVDGCDANKVSVTIR